MVMRNSTSEVSLFMSARKGRQLRGWVAKIISWDLNQKPVLQFARWISSSGYNSQGGTVVFTDTFAGQIVLFRANAPSMNSRDKFTNFGRVIRNVDGSLTICSLEGGIDAREEWLKPRIVGVPSETAEAALKLLAEAHLRGTTTELQLVADAISTVLLACFCSSRKLKMDGHDYMVVADKLRARLASIGDVEPLIEPFSAAYAGWFSRWMAEREEITKQKKIGAAYSARPVTNRGAISVLRNRVFVYAERNFSDNQCQKGNIQLPSEISSFLLSAPSVLF